MQRRGRWVSGISLSLAVIAGCGIVACTGIRPAPLMAQAVLAPPANAPAPPASDLVYQCPMDPDQRSNRPGLCPKCGMTMVAGIPEPEEFPMSFSIAPRSIKPGAKETLTFGVNDPANGKKVVHFQVVHEKLIHMFVVSQDLAFFVHDHPVPVLDKFAADVGVKTMNRQAKGFAEDDGGFRYILRFPRPGLYRVLGDFCPDGAACQLSAKSVIVPGETQQIPTLARDYGPKKTTDLENGAVKTMNPAAAMTATITTEPQEPIAGSETRIFLHLDNSDGLEQYLGAWAHMLAASDDLIDLIHTHPWQADGSADMQFHVYFGRQHTYRVWFQFQKKGAVHTVHFDIPVKDLD